MKPLLGLTSGDPRPLAGHCSEDLRRFRLCLTRTHALSSTINVTLSALRFLFAATLDRPDAYARPPIA
jgi:hypothetical protein